MNLEINPGVGFGKLTFGQSKDEVRGVLGDPSRTLKQNEYSQGEMDVYEGIGVNTHYEQDKLILIEFIGPESPTYQGENILGVEDAAAWVQSLDDKAQIALPNITSESLGIAFYVPENEARILGIAKEGYYAV